MLIILDDSDKSFNGDSNRWDMDGALTVTQFNERVRMLITTSDTVRDVAVIGEISNLKQASSGHYYFSLKEGKAVVNCTMFRYVASRVTFKLEPGMKVTAFGSASYYSEGGSFNFNITSIEPAGKGEQQIALEKLTAKLVEEGLFDPERKRPLPRYPKAIGVVTSSKGAVIKDIIDTTARRYPVDIILSPATVQGEEAPRSLVEAIGLLQSEDIDLMIVGRGGGSAEDLSAFNDESVVRALSECKVPVISAVGHATDKTLCDRVADKYAETPTAAAMLATPDRKEENRNINSIWTRMDNALEAVIERMNARFMLLDRRLSPRNAKAIVDVYESKFRNASDNIDSLMRLKIGSCRGRFSYCDSKLDPKRLVEKLNGNLMTLDGLISRMDRSMEFMLKSKNRDLESITMKMEGLDPNNVLLRGYSLIRDSEGNVVTSVNDLFPGTDVTIAMRDGTALAKIRELRQND